MIVGDPSGFDMSAVEKDSETLSAFADNPSHVRLPPNWSVARMVSMIGRVAAVMQITDSKQKGRPESRPLAC